MLKCINNRNFLYIYIVFSTVAFSHEYSSNELYENINSNDCSVFSASKYDALESSYAISYSQGCAEKYMRHISSSATSNEIGLALRVLSLVGRIDLIREYYLSLLPHISKDIAQGIIFEGCVNGTEIDIYKESYGLFYGDFEEFRLNVVKYCKKTD